MFYFLYTLDNEAEQAKQPAMRQQAANNDRKTASTTATQKRRKIKSICMRAPNLGVTQSNEPKEQLFNVLAIIHSLWLRPGKREEEEEEEIVCNV